MLSDFMAFYFSDAWQAIDWERPHRFLDQELQKIVPESDTGRRVVAVSYTHLTLPTSDLV